VKYILSSVHEVFLTDYGHSLPNTDGTGNWSLKWLFAVRMTRFVDVNVANTADNTVTSVDSDSKDMDESTSGATSLGTSGAPAHRDEYDWEHLSEPPDAGEIDQRNSDSSDFEETYIKRKTRRKDKKVNHHTVVLFILFMVNHCKNGIFVRTIIAVTVGIMLWPCVYRSVCHKSEFYQNGR